MFHIDQAKEIEIRIRRTWNSIGDVDEAAHFLVKGRVFDTFESAQAAIAPRYAVYERHLGCTIFPAGTCFDLASFNDETGLVPKRPVDPATLDPAYAAWKGLIGQGATLKRILAADRTKRAVAHG